MVLFDCSGTYINIATIESIDFNSANEHHADVRFVSGAVVSISRTDAVKLVELIRKSTANTH